MARPKLDSTKARELLVLAEASITSQIQRQFLIDLADRYIELAKLSPLNSGDSA